MNIGENIKKYRKEKKLTQIGLADEIYKSESTIQKYEGGSVAPDIKTLTDIAKALGVDLWDLVSDEKEVEAAKEAQNITRNFKHNPNISSKLDTQYILKKSFNGNDLKELSKTLNIPFYELENAINSTSKLSLDSFQKICAYLKLANEEEAFWYANYLCDANREPFKVVAFYKYLIREYGTKYNSINDGYIDACEAFCNKFGYNFNLDSYSLDKSLVTDVVNNLDEYKKIIINMYNNYLYSDLVHENVNIDNLTDEEYYTIYKELIETLDIQLFKIEKSKKIDKH